MQAATAMDVSVLQTWSVRLLQIHSKLQEKTSLSLQIIMFYHNTLKILIQK